MHLHIPRRNTLDLPPVVLDNRSAAAKPLEVDFSSVSLQRSPVVALEDPASFLLSAGDVLHESDHVWYLYSLPSVDTLFADTCVYVRAPPVLSGSLSGLRNCVFMYGGGSDALRARPPTLPFGSSSGGIRFPDTFDTCGRASHGQCPASIGWIQMHIAVILGGISHPFWSSARTLCITSYMMIYFFMF